MANKNEDIIFWIVGVIIFIIVATNLEVLPNFAIVQKTVCIDNKISYYPGPYSFNGTNSINIPVDTNANATVMWIKNYSKGDVNYFFLSRINGVNYVNAAQSNSRLILPLGPTFGLGLNGSVKEIGTFTNLSLSTLKDIYNNGTGREICYTLNYEENVTCKDYATSKSPDTGNGCLVYNGTYYPSCTYEWKPIVEYKFIDNKCEKQYYCSADYLTLTQCNAELNATISVNTTAPVITSAENPIVQGEGLNKEVFNIAGYSIKLYYLLILLIVVIALIYFNRK